MMKDSGNNGANCTGPSRNGETSRRLVLFIILAVLLHLPLLELVFFFGRLQPRPQSQGPVEITEVMLVRPDEADEIKKRLAQEEDKKKESQDRLKGQVVELSKVVDERPPEQETRHLADRDSRVDEERKKRGRPGPAEPQKIARPPEPVTAPQAPTPPEKSQPQEQMVEIKQEPEITLPDASQYSLLHRYPSQEKAQLKVELPEPSKGLGQAKRETPKQPPSQYSALLPSATGPSSQAGDGTGGTDDYLPHVNDGDDTILNANQFRYWSFFQRVKEGVRQNWSPTQEFSRRDPTGKVYGVKDRMTVVRVTLNGDGSLRDLFVVNDSGLEFLDREALMAFRRAQPFPNPPNGLKDENGLISFQFGFFLEINRRPSLRMFRY